MTTSMCPFERSSKRRRGFPSETKVKRGLRYVRGDKDLLEKLGRNDLCPCGSGRCFQALLHDFRKIRRKPTQLLLFANKKGAACAAPLSLVRQLNRDYLPAVARLGYTSTG